MIAYRRLALLLFAAFISTCTLSGQKDGSTKNYALLRGRILADVHSVGFGAGIGLPVSPLFRVLRKPSPGHPAQRQWVPSQFVFEIRLIARANGTPIMK